MQKSRRARIGVYRRVSFRYHLPTTTSLGTSRATCQRLTVVAAAGAAPTRTGGQERDLKWRQTEWNRNTGEARKDAAMGKNKNKAKCKKKEQLKIYVLWASYACFLECAFVFCFCCTSLLCWALLRYARLFFDAGGQYCI